MPEYSPATSLSLTLYSLHILYNVPSGMITYLYCYATLAVVHVL